MEEEAFFAVIIIPPCLRFTPTCDAHRTADVAVLLNNPFYNGGRV